MKRKRRGVEKGQGSNKVLILTFNVSLTEIEEEKIKTRKKAQMRSLGWAFVRRRRDASGDRLHSTRATLYVLFNLGTLLIGLTLGASSLDSLSRKFFFPSLEDHVDVKSGKNDEKSHRVSHHG